MQLAIKQDILNRLRSIEGHVRGIERMVEDDDYCIDIMKQIKAVQKALDRVNTLILANHLQTCVTDAMRSQDDNERTRVIDEIIALFDASARLTR
ncbi:MAG: metal-sensitive transcriptional regulator [Anaerolineae bacterium]|nr:metal-sensitive transcriptional regulator [Caldilineales bacterium]MCX7853856.1 metal-sensitive transcriptional regulator [Caldilineales bacterium]MDW8268511.1 metal-sensitive transcriptional regulator [Anaerolineae bacterium]